MISVIFLIHVWFLANPVISLVDYTQGTDTDGLSRPKTNLVSISPLGQGSRNEDLPMREMRNAHACTHTHTHTRTHTHTNTDTHKHRNHINHINHGNQRISWRSKIMNRNQAIYCIHMYVQHVCRIQIKSNQIKSNQIKPNQIKSNQPNHNK